MAQNKKLGGRTAQSLKMESYGRFVGNESTEMAHSVLSERVSRESQPVQAALCAVPTLRSENDSEGVEGFFAQFAVINVKNTNLKHEANSKSSI